uniref:Plakophilin 4 n=1 Tax=Scleropages formosus TaxID=113540 RepID=A0A8C9TB82_SCLFO
MCIYRNRNPILHRAGIQMCRQLERCRLGSESPGAASARYAASKPKQPPTPAADFDTKPRVTDGSQSPTYCIRSELEQVTLYSPEQTSLHESEGSGGNSRSSTQMNSYSDSGYQDACSYYSSQNLGKAELRLQHSYPGTGSGGGSAIARHARPEGQASVQVHSTASGRAMRRVSSVPSRTQSPAYGSSASPSRGSLRTLLGSAYSSPVATEPKPPSAVFSASTLPASQQPCSPASLRRVGSASSRPGSAGRNASPYRASGHASSPADGPPAASTSPSPVRSGMTAVPQHYGSTLPRSLAHESDPFGQRSYDLYERMVPPRPDSLAGLRSSYASQHSPMGQELRATVSPDRHITPIYEDRTFQSPLYRSRNHSTVDLNHSSQSAIYRTGSGVGNLQRTLSQRSTMTYHRGNYGVNSAAAYAEPYHSGPYHSTEPSYGRQAIAADGGATRSPSIDSIQKDPREFAWRDPELPEVIHMLQHQFPSVQANAAAYLQHLCFGDNRIKAEVCRLGGIKHLVDLLDHKVLEVQRNACGALRNLVYGKATDENKTAVRNVGGVPALLRLLRKTSDAEIRELVTGVLWNLSSCDAVKMTIIRDALSTLTNTVIIPHSGWSSSGFDDEHKLKFHSSLVLRNTTGCLRNLSSAGEEARKQMRCCEGLVDSLLHVIKACVNTSDFDSKIVENCICTLRNLSYRLELEMPQSRLLGAQELDGLLGSESPSRDVESSCWGRKKKKKKKSSQDDQWDGVGPIPGFSKSPKGAEMLWHPAVVKPYLTLLAESSNPATLEGSAGSLQNLSAGNWKATGTSSVAVSAQNGARVGKYAMRDLVNRLPGGNTTLLSDETVAAICCTLHEVTSKNMENAKALADTGGIEKLVSITKGRGERYSMKVVKAAAQVLNTLWQYRDLRAIYKKDGWNQNHFITPVSTLERDKYKSQPALPSSTLQMSPVIQSAGSATSSPAMLGIKEHRSNYQRTQSAMQFYKYQGDGNTSPGLCSAGSGKPSPFFIGSYSSPTREEPRRAQHQLYYADEPSRRNHDTYRMYLQSPRGYEDPYFEDGVHFPPAADYSSSQPQALKSTANYVDFYSTTRRPSYRAEQYPGSPDSWV